MTIPNIPDTDSFDLWRQKCNLIAMYEGDLDNLLTVDQSNLVAAINEIYTNITELERSLLVRAIAMS